MEENTQVPSRVEIKNQVPKRYLSIQELSAYIGCSVSTIYKKVSKRQIPFVPVTDTTYRFDIKAIDKWMEKRLIPASPKVDDPDPEQ